MKSSATGPLMRDKWKDHPTYARTPSAKALHQFPTQHIVHVNEDDFSDTVTEILEWLWPRVLPLGKLCL